MYLLKNDCLQHYNWTYVNNRLKKIENKPNTNIAIALVFCLAFNTSRFITDAYSKTLLVKSFTSCVCNY